jgi:hypothetical protein
LYSSPNIIRAIKSRRMRWAGHVVHMGRCGLMQGECKILVGKPEGRAHLEEPGVDGMIILKWTLQEVKMEGVI